jgi:hypothetical protein
MPNNGDTFFNSFTSRVATPNTTTTNPLANVSQDWTLNTQSNHEGSNTNAVSNTSNTTSRLPSFLPPIDTLVNSSMEFTPDAVENDTAPGMVTAAPLYGSAAESMDWMNNLQPIPNEFATDAATGADTTTAGSVPFSDEPMDISTMSDMESDPSGFGTGTDTLPGADTSVVSAPSSAGPVDMFGNINYDFSLDPSWTGTDNTAAASASTSATPWNTSNTGNMTFGLTGSEMNTLMTEGVVNVWRPISAASVDLSSIPDMAFNPSSGTGTGTAPTANTGTAPADMSNNENMEFYFDILPPGMGAVPSNVTASDTSSNVNMDFSSWTGMNTAPDADTTTTTTANTSAAGPIDTYGTGNNSGFETDAIPDAAAMTTATNDTPAPLPSHVAPTDLYSFDNSEFLFHPATNSDLDTAESPSTMLPAPEPVNGNTNTVSGVEVTPSTNVPTQEQEDEVTNNNTADAYDPAPTFEGAEFFDWEALAQWGNENNNNNGDDDEDDGDTPMN